MMDGSCFPLKTRLIRHKLGLAEAYLTENKIHPSPIRTRSTLFNGKQDAFVTNWIRVQQVLICDGWILFSVKLGSPSPNL
jgi:hypothetical protein